jgi:hypothetical protein
MTTIPKIYVRTIHFFYENPISVEALKQWNEEELSEEDDKVNMRDLIIGLDIFHEDWRQKEVHICESELPKPFKINDAPLVISKKSLWYPFLITGKKRKERGYEDFNYLAPVKKTKVEAEFHTLESVLLVLHKKIQPHRQFQPLEMDHLKEDIYVKVRTYLKSLDLGTLKKSNAILHKDVKQLHEDVKVILTHIRTSNAGVNLDVEKLKRDVEELFEDTGSLDTILNEAIGGLNGGIQGVNDSFFDFKKQTRERFEKAESAIQDAKNNLPNTLTGAEMNRKLDSILSQLSQNREGILQRPPVQHDVLDQLDGAIGAVQHASGFTVEEKTQLLNLLNSNYACCKANTLLSEELLRKLNADTIVWENIKTTIFAFHDTVEATLKSFGTILTSVNAHYQQLNLAMDINTETSPFHIILNEIKSFRDLYDRNEALRTEQMNILTDSVYTKTAAGLAQGIHHNEMLRQFQNLTLALGIRLDNLQTAFSPDLDTPMESDIEEQRMTGDNEGSINPDLLRRRSRRNKKDWDPNDPRKPKPPGWKKPKDPGHDSSKPKPAGWKKPKDPGHDSSKPKPKGAPGYQKPKNEEHDSSKPKGKKPKHSGQTTEEDDNMVARAFDGYNSGTDYDSEATWEDEQMVAEANDDVETIEDDRDY